MLSLALALAVASTQGPITLSAASSKEPPPPQVIESPAQVVALCNALTPSGRLRTKGNVVARARAEAAHDERRDAALDRRYRIRMTMARPAFAPYDPEEKRLSLSERAFLTGAGGSLRIAPVDDAGLPVVADAPTAERISQAAQRKTLALELTFTLPDDDDEDVMCAHVAGSDRYTLGVEPFSWAYLEGDQILARGGEGSDRPHVTASDKASPRVSVTNPLGEGGAGLRDAVQAHAKELLACYTQALGQSPSLDGTYVAELELGKGKAKRIRIAADSVQDQAMAKCVTAVLQTVNVARQAPAKAKVSIRFDLEPEEAADAGAGK